MDVAIGRLHLRIAVTVEAPRQCWPGRGRAGPEGEGPLARALRWAADGRRLAELDARLLRDVGLAPGDVDRGVPFDQDRG